MPPPPVLGLDIETDTTENGLDPTVAAIVAVAVSSRGGERVFSGAEREILAGVDAHLAGLEPGVIATWNGAGFDLPFLAYRAQRHGLTIGLDIAADPMLSLNGTRLPGIVSGCRAAWHGHGHLDAYRLYRADTVRTLAIGGGLKLVAKACGLQPVEVDASRIHELTPAEIEAYVASDARCTRLLVERRWPAAMSAVDRLPIPRPVPQRRAGEPQRAARPTRKVLEHAAP